ncbi:MAG: 50S ribosomal protein L1 [Candidatus Diapherotrites archaeon]|nr:50S ribosomal protein L1 [Candidatus Diapherotrites archaeon]
MKLAEAIEKAKADSKKRNFVQSMDLFINFKSIDFNKQDNKISLEVLLPKGRGKDQKICVICSDEMASSAKAAADKVILSNELESMGKDPKKIKSLANDYDAFIAQANLMPLVGKFLGQALGPRGKMPKPVPPNADLKPLVARLKNTLIIKTTGKNLPVLHVPFGTEEMTTEDLVANATAVLSAIKAKIPSPQNIGSVRVKTTMGPTVAITEGI